MCSVLRECGHNVEVACCDEPSSPWLAHWPVRVFGLGPSLGTYGIAPRLPPWLYQHAPDYDIVVIHGHWQFHGLAGALILRKRGIPYFIFAHGMLGPWFRDAYPLKHLKKSLYWRFIEHRIVSGSRFLLFTCEEERAAASGSFKPYRAQEKVVGLGIRPPLVDPKRVSRIFNDQYPYLKDKRFLLFVGRLHPVKACDILIKSFSLATKDANEMRLVIAGPDQVGLKAQLQLLAQDVGVEDRITWTGPISGDLKWGAYFNCDALVLPSHHENFGIVVVEALSCGKCVLISNKVNIWREVERFGAGLVGEDTVRGMTSILEDWTTMQSSTMAGMREQALLCYKEMFDVRISTKNLLDTMACALGACTDCLAEQEVTRSNET